MHILWLTPSLPSPTTGARMRQFALIRELAHKHDFTVLSFASDFELQYVDLLRQYCEVVTVPLRRPPPVGRWRNRVKSWGRLLFRLRPTHSMIYPTQELEPVLRSLLARREFDLANLEFLHTTPLADHLGDMPIVLTEHNIESAIQLRLYTHSRRPIQKLQAGIEWLKLRRFEATQLRRFPVCVVVSEIDGAQCRRMAPRTRVYVVPNGVDSMFFAPAHNAQREQYHLLFAGSMNYRPNVDAVSYFCSDIWPTIADTLPETRLTIAGAEPTEGVRRLSNLPGVTVTGFVNDMRPCFWQASICVVPLRIAGGTRLKILEALAAGCPVVSTTTGAEGLDLEPGVDFLLADTPDEFAASTVRLLADTRLREKLSAHGKDTVERKYDWKIIAPRLDSIYQEVIAEDHSRER